MNDLATLPLFALPPMVTVPSYATLQQRFEAFHAANPQVYDALRGMALAMKHRGMARYSVKALWEVLRFQAIATHGDAYKLNNSYASAYARLLMEREPELAGFFETRQSKFDKEKRNEYRKSDHRRGTTDRCHVPDIAC